jgi:hypothetical protein
MMAPTAINATPTTPTGPEVNPVLARAVLEGELPDPAAITKLADPAPAPDDDSDAATPALGSVTMPGVVTGVDTATLELGNVEMLGLVTGVDTTTLELDGVEQGALEDGADGDPYGLVDTTVVPSGSVTCVAEACGPVIATKSQPAPATTAATPLAARQHLTILISHPRK